MADPDPEFAERLRELAVGVVATLVSAPVDSSEFRRAFRSVETLGEREVRTTTAIADRFQDRPVHALEEALSERMPLARNNRDLRRIAKRLTEVASGRADGGEARREIEEAAERVGELIAALDADRSMLHVDNVALAQQERALWREIRAIRDHAALAAQIDEQLEDRIEAIATTAPDRARLLRDEVMYAVRQRRRDLLLHLAVATQGYAALRRIEQGNLELIWMIRTMTTTTMAALRTAVLASQANSFSPAEVSDRLADARTAWQGVVASLDEVDARRRTTLTEAQAGKPG